jgi:NADH dehydrogenase FAD-containing subunit
MNTLSLDIQRAELARRILNETDERIVMDLMRYFSNTKPLIHKRTAAKKVTFNSVTLDTRSYKFNREEANAR